MMITARSLWSLKSRRPPRKKRKGETFFQSAGEKRFEKGLPQPFRVDVCAVRREAFYSADLSQQSKKSIFSLC
jgi:hypothetical protein